MPGRFSTSLTLEREAEVVEAEASLQEAEARGEWLILSLLILQ